GYGVVFKTQDDVTLSEPGFVGGTVLDHFSDTDAACLAQAVATQVLLIDILPVNSKINVTFLVELEIKDFIRCIRCGRRGSLLSERNARAKTQGDRQVDNFLNRH